VDPVGGGPGIGKTVFASGVGHYETEPETGPQDTAHGASTASGLRNAAAAAANPA